MESGMEWSGQPCPDVFSQQILFASPCPLFTVWLNLFMPVQMVVGWTRQRKSRDTQGARFLLPLGSAGSLLPGLLCPNVIPLLVQNVQSEPPSLQSSCTVFDRPGSDHFH